jgi:hypothetical protein
MPQGNETLDTASMPPGNDTLDTVIMARKEREKNGQFLSSLKILTILNAINVSFCRQDSIMTSIVV